jgi:hypothetical protein
MTSNHIMTPAEIKKAAADLNNQNQANELKLVDQVRKWFDTNKQTTYATINQTIIKHTAANIENYAFSVDVTTYNSNKLPLTISRDRKYNIISDESQKQCALIGAFIRAQGHNLTSVDYRLYEHYGLIDETDISCVFTFGYTEKNTKK